MRKSTIKLGEEVYELSGFKYPDLRNGLQLKFESHTIIISNRVESVRMNKDEVLIRDYGTTKGIYAWLVAEGIVGQVISKVTIGEDEAIKCKLLKNV